MNSPNNSNRRLFDRINAAGAFIVDGKTYPMRDISVGGLRLEDKLEGAEKGSITSGKVFLTQSTVRIYSDVVCHVIDNNEMHGARLKFVNISEEFVEFLRSFALRHMAPTDYEASWISSNSYELSQPDNVQVKRSVFKRVFRLETLITVTIFAIALLLLSRASSEQNFWVVSQHELLSSVSGEITSLHPDEAIDVGSVIANIKISTLSDQDTDFPVVSRVRGQTLNWHFNVGDNVVEGDLLGVIGLTPLNDGGAKAIIGLESPLLSLTIGDLVKVSNTAYGSMDALVKYAVTPTQAAALTGRSPDSFEFEEYFLVELDAPSNVPLAGQLRVNVFSTWFHHFTSTVLPQ